MALESLSGLVSSLQDSTNNLNSVTSKYYLEYVNNFNFISGNLVGLDNNLTEINKAFNSIKQFNNESFKLFLTQKISSLERVFKEMFTTNDLLVYDDNINNKIFFNLRDAMGNVVLEKQKFNFSNRVSSLYNFPFNPIELGIDVGTYIMTIYYEDNSKVYEFDGHTDVMDYVTSNDGNLQRIILDNETNKISENLRNYKIYLVSKVGNSIINKQTMVNSRISNTELDIIFFTLLKSDEIGFSDYKLIIKEELFDTINIELTIGEYEFNDVASLILGNAERDLKTGEFTVYDALGNSLGTMVSTRFGRKEFRRRIR